MFFQTSAVESYVNRMQTVTDRESSMNELTTQTTDSTKHVYQVWKSIEVSYKRHACGRHMLRKKAYFRIKREDGKELSMTFVSNYSEWKKLKIKHGHQIIENF